VGDDSEAGEQFREEDFRELCDHLSRLYELAELARKFRYEGLSKSELKKLIDLVVEAIRHSIGEVVLVECFPVYNEDVKDYVDTCYLSVVAVIDHAKAEPTRLREEMYSVVERAKRIHATIDELATLPAAWASKCRISETGSMRLRSMRASARLTSKSCLREAL